MKEGQPQVDIEASGFQHKEYLHHVLNGRIPGDDIFNHHQFILIGRVSGSETDLE